jgi:hypothetical protein
MKVETSNFKHEVNKLIFDDICQLLDNMIRLQKYCIENELFHVDAIKPCYISSMSRVLNAHIRLLIQLDEVDVFWLIEKLVDIMNTLKLNRNKIRICN